jgi:uncharacterized protein YdeI (YjbR/CyaY-like superfamily)
MPLQITTTLYTPTRKEWRKWLQKNYDKATEIWLVYYNKSSGKASIPYSDAVEEALCFGWIDSTIKKFEADSTAQRFTPRKAKSPWSELNKERARKMIAAGLMTPAGEAKLCDLSTDNFTIPPEILQPLKADKSAWKNFQQFPAAYQRIRVGYLAETIKRPEEFKKRLAYFLKMTAQNKMFGTMP